MIPLPPKDAAAEPTLLSVDELRTLARTVRTLRLRQCHISQRRAELYRLMETVAEDLANDIDADEFVLRVAFDDDAEAAAGDHKP